MTLVKPEKCSIPYWFPVVTAKGVGAKGWWKERLEESPKMGSWGVLC